VLSWIERQAQLGALAERQLFFVGGAPRSGTTWVQHVLASHPDVSCRGEGHFLHFLAEPMGGLMQRRRADLEAKNARLKETGGSIAGGGRYGVSGWQRDPAGAGAAECGADVPGGRPGFSTMSGGRAAEVERSGSFFRKGIAGDWVSTLTPEMTTWVLAAIGGLFPQFGWQT
jgi:hypothetical protein